MKVKCVQCGTLFSDYTYCPTCHEPCPDCENNKLMVKTCKTCDQRGYVLISRVKYFEKQCEICNYVYCVGDWDSCPNCRGLIVHDDEEMETNKMNNLTEFDIDTVVDSLKKSRNVIEREQTICTNLIKNHLAIEKSASFDEASAQLVMKALYLYAEHIDKRHNSIEQLLKHFQEERNTI